MNPFKWALALLPALSLAACSDPLEERRVFSRLQNFSLAAMGHGFDAKGNLVLSSAEGGEQGVVRFDHEKQVFQRFGEGMPEGFIASWFYTDGRGRLVAVAGNVIVERGAEAAAWSLIAPPPREDLPGEEASLVSAEHVGVDRAGNLFAVYLVTQSSGAPWLQRIFRRAPGASSWTPIHVVERDVAPHHGVTELKVRGDGTVFFTTLAGPFVLTPGASSPVPLVSCPSERIDQQCEALPQVVVSAFHDETYLAQARRHGVFAGYLRRVPEGASFPLDWDALPILPAPDELNEWSVLRLDRKGGLFAATSADVTLDYPPFHGKEAVLYSLAPDEEQWQPLVRFLSPRSWVVSDHEVLYSFGSQLAGGHWVSDPVYSLSF